LRYGGDDALAKSKASTATDDDPSCDFATFRGQKPGAVSVDLK
jgi:hypothetical protein